MNKRQFIKTGLLAGAATGLSLKVNAAPAKSIPKKKKLKNWVWIGPDPKDTADQLNSRYKAFKEAGISAVLFEADSEKHFRAAKAQGLEAHRWMWTFNRAEQVTANPQWYSKNRKGESCADHPPYVNYYRWLCPSRPEVQQYLEQQVTDIVNKDYIDGVHLDYVRYCDVILPVNLWDHYNLVQTVEMPEYDFCYCEVCQAHFKDQYGKDITAIQYPEASLSWRLFRYGNITRVVNSLSDIAHSKNKKITAAVFPTPEVARRNVRQDWTNWNLDGVCPMIYHGFYKESVSWIGDAVKEGTHFLAGKFPLYAGLYLSDFKSDDEIRQGIQYAIKNGAAGVSFFGNVENGNTLNILKEFMI